MIFKKRWQPATGYIAAFIDSGRQHCPAVLTVPDGVVGSTTEKRNPKWRTGNYHKLPSKVRAPKIFSRCEPRAKFGSAENSQRPSSAKRNGLKKRNSQKS